MLPTDYHGMPSLVFYLIKRCRLLKTFLRELPTSLMNDMYGAFIQAQKLPSPAQRLRAILLICHQLPLANVRGINTGSWATGLSFSADAPAALSYAVLP